jgi:acyl-coenzyme A synthetase/AMP-(fatty) acid ligase
VEYRNAMELTDMRIFAVLSDSTRMVDEAYRFELLSRLTLLLKDTVSEQASPGSIVFVESLPKTISGKILRRLLRYVELPATAERMVVTLPESVDMTILGSV